MFTSLTEQPVDSIMQIAYQFRADPRPDKIDLGVGVYKDARGITPVMRAVKAAERRIVETQETKAYLALTGDPAYLQAMAGLVLGDAVAADEVASVATPGGTGAVRQGFEMIRMANPAARVFVSNPTWPNHAAILKYLGIPMIEYRYFDEETRGFDFAGMMADLAAVRRGDVVLLHGCCHNPTGAGPNPAEWQAIAGFLRDRGAVAMIDIAYQGFGDGLDEDAAATRMIAATLPETLIAASCSKNFGIYRERTGCLMAVSRDGAGRSLAQGAMTSLNRLNYSFPPDHGARVVSTILTDPDLRADWAAELEEVRRSMLALRRQLAAQLQARTGSDRFAFIAQHRGMFSRLGCTPEQVARMRADRAIYMVGDSRMNIAGLNAATVPVLAQAIVEAGI